MTSHIQSQFTVTERSPANYFKYENSDSENEQVQIQQPIVNPKEKKVKKLIDTDLIRNEFSNRPIYDKEVTTNQVRRLSRKSTKINIVPKIFNQIIPTSLTVVEQINQLKQIRRISDELPPELITRFYSELRYLYVPAMSVVYKQGDQQKRYYVVIEGCCAVMKPREKMVGISRLELEDQLQKADLKPTEYDPYGLRNAFPDYLVLRIIRMGDAFGEAAIKLNTVRSSTVIALENTHLLYLPENAYNQTIDPHISKVLDDKIIYFQQCQLFKNIDISDFMGILLECRFVTYKSGDIVYEENQKSQYLYFIVNGMVELSKQVQQKQLVLSSYGEFQQFGDVEIMRRINRYAKARVISPRMAVYKIRKSKFFDNLGNYLVYENMKKSALTVFKHQKMIYENALLSVNPKDEIFQAAQDAMDNKFNKNGKSLVNKKILEGQKLSQVKIFQNMADPATARHSSNSPNHVIMQKVYSNTLQQYQQKLMKKPHSIAGDGDLTIRGSNNYQTEGNSGVYDSKSQRIDESYSGRKGSVPRLPSINSPVATPVSIDSVLESIRRLPKVPKNNIVLSLMYQQAYKYDNPDKKAKQIQQVISAAFRNVRKQFEPKEPAVMEHNNSNLAMLTNLGIPNMIEKKRRREQHRDDYVSIVSNSKIIH